MLNYYVENIFHIEKTEYESMLNSLIFEINMICYM